jgi:hypothetical protein
MAALRGVEAADMEPLLRRNFEAAFGKPENRWPESRAATGGPRVEDQRML